MTKTNQITEQAYTHVLVHKDKAVVKFYAVDKGRAQKIARAYVRLSAPKDKTMFKLFIIIKKEKK